MPTFHDPAADAAEAQQALRGLAYASPHHQRSTGGLRGPNPNVNTWEATCSRPMAGTSTHPFDQPCSIRPT